MAEMVYKTVIFISIVAVVVAVFILKSNLALAVSVAALVIAFILLLSKYWWLKIKNPAKSTFANEAIAPFRRVAGSNDPAVVRVGLHVSGSAWWAMLLCNRVVSPIASCWFRLGA
jgi:hypothetical protein